MPRWAAAALLVAIVANIAGFATESRPVLVGSYIVLLAAFVPVALRLVGAQGSVVTPRTRTATVAAR